PAATGRSAGLEDHALPRDPGVGAGVEDISLGVAPKMLRAGMAVRVNTPKFLDRPGLGAAGDEEQPVRQEGVAATEQVPDGRGGSRGRNTQAGAVKQAGVVEHPEVMTTRVMLIAAEKKDLAGVKQGCVDREDLSETVLCGCGGAFRNNE